MNTNPAVPAEVQLISSLFMTEMRKRLAVQRENIENLTPADSRFSTIYAGIQAEIRMLEALQSTLTDVIDSVYPQAQ